MHPSSLSKYGKEKTVGSGASGKQKADPEECPTQPTAKKLCQDRLQVAGGIIALTQERVDRLITDFVIQDMQSFNVVEQPSFIRLIQGLQPTKNVISRKVVTSTVARRFSDMCLMLTNMFCSIRYLCTTADIWSSHNRGFFGTTIHWIDENTLQRRSAAIGCSRFKGKHTYDVIASTLEQIHIKYGIGSKVVLTITDNGSNFLKAFRVFGAEAYQADLSTQGMPMPTENVDTSDDEVNFTNMETAMEKEENSDDLSFTLPSHKSCASHTLNLIATHDAAKATKESSYKKIFYSTMGKCSALWNKFSRSVQAAELIKDELQCALIVPNETRWNAYYDAVNRIREITVRPESKLRAVCQKLGLVAFHPNEVTFITEYCMVMKHVAEALDILQAERNCFLGTIIPTLLALRTKLLMVKHEVKLVSPLLSAVLVGLETRFGPSFEADDLIIATVTLPQFRLRWCTDDGMREKARNLLKYEMSLTRSSVVKDVASAKSTSSEDFPDEGFFTFETGFSQQASTAQSELELYLADERKSLDTLHKFPLVKEVFLKFNTGIPSSAPVERLFSLGGQIMTPRRNRLSDEHFEMLVLLRANKDL